MPSRLPLETCPRASPIVGGGGDAGGLGAPDRDAHDKLVYGRYERGPKPGKIHYEFEMKHEELAHTATEEDVNSGKAVFTLDGLGEHRVWKLPECPQFSVWLTPDTHGSVCQAEELLVGGAWKRYFGLACEQGLCVVPASEVEILLPSGDLRGVDWQDLPQGVDWGVTFPCGDPMKEGCPSPAVGDPLPVQVFLRNRSGVAREVPDGFYRDASAGGPAFLTGVRITAAFAPFQPNNPDEEYPRSSDFKPLEPIRRDEFHERAPGRTLECGQSFKAFTFDLRDWFKLEEPGSYEFSFAFDRKALGLEGKSRMGFLSMGFTIGTAPKTPTPAEANRGIDPFGGAEKEARLRKLIHDTILQGGKGKPADAPPWSAPVEGLAARIDYVCQESDSGLTVLVALKNVSDHPLVVPTGNASKGGKPSDLELWSQGADGTWHRIGWASGEPIEAAKPESVNEDRGGGWGGEATGNQVERPRATLQPGESALAFLCGKQGEGVRKAASIKVVVRPSEGTVAGAWNGVVETPPHAARMPEEADLPTGSLPFPDVFPEFSRVRFMGGNMSGEECMADRLAISNRELIQAIRLYAPEEVRVELDRRIAKEAEPDVRMFLIALATSAGSETAALHLLDALKETDYQVVRNVHWAIREVLGGFDGDPPEWIVDMAEVALSDDRYVTGLEKTNWARGTTFKVSYLADEEGHLALTLGSCHCERTVPFLIDMARRTKGTRFAVEALASSGDARAIPVLVELLTAVDHDPNLERHWYGSGPGSELVEALGRLRAKEALPLLLKHLESTSVIEALERIGDASAVAPLRDLVTAKGRVLEGGTPIDSLPVIESDRLFAARLALEAGDPFPRYYELLADRSLGEFDRRKVVWRLGDRPDARSIPHLIEAIKTDPSGVVVNQVITVLSVFKYKAAVEGLIGCFDADFAGKADWKRAYEPEMFQDNIAESLQRITGETIGPEKARWQRWWEENKAKRADLK